MAKKIRTWVTDQEDAERKAAKAAAAEQRKLNPPPKGNPHWKGRGGNAGGRPRGYPEFAQRARARTYEELAILDRLIRNPKTSATTKIEAIKTKWAWGWGKPPQTVVVEQKHLRAMTDDELTAMIRQAKEEERYTKQIELKPDDVTIN
jgi:hypothetical protein